MGSLRESARGLHIARSIRNQRGKERVRRGITTAGRADQYLAQRFLRGGRGILHFDRGFVDANGTSRRDR